MRSTTKPLIAVVLAFITLSSFSGRSKESWIPADFDCRKSVLLVEQFEWHIQEKADKRNVEMREELKNSYPYKAELVSGEDIQNSSKYADKDKYRYALMWTSSSQSSYGSAGQPTASAATSNPIFHFYILDRKLGQRYPQNPKLNSYIMRVFKPVLEELVEYLKALK